MEWYNRQACEQCQRLVAAARGFNAIHAKVPPRYASAGLDEIKIGSFVPKAGGSYLLTGGPGIGKTYLAYQMIRRELKLDPRKTGAAYRWPALLLALQEGYKGNTDSEGAAMVSALRTASVALIDDIGAEKISAANIEWIRQSLYLVLDDRWQNMGQTIITTNLPPEELEEYLGSRIISRVNGICHPVVISGKDKRQRGNQ